MKTKRTFKRTQATSPALFDASKDFEQNAYPETSHNSWHLRAQSFRHAAERLIDGWPDWELFEKNTLIYPVLFTFRMYLELTLKDMIREESKTISGSAAEQGGHPLMPLWATCRKAIQRRKLPVGQAKIWRLEGYLKEFDVVDPKSETFRYPERKDGTLWFQQTPSPIDLANLQMAMHDLAELLDTVENLLDIDIDLENQFRNDFYSDW